MADEDGWTIKKLMKGIKRKYLQPKQNYLTFFELDLQPPTVQMF